MSNQTADVIVREVGMRDGLQSIDQFMPTEEKLAWLHAEHAAGVREIEVTSLVPKSVFPQFADAETVVQEAKKLDNLTTVVLVPNLRGAERALELGVDKIDFVVSVSESHNRENVRRTTDESFEDFERIVGRFTEAGEDRPKVCGGLSTAFGCTIEGAVSEDRTRHFANRLAEAGADEILLADTVGYANPASIARVFSSVIADLGPDIPVCGHFHDTRGLGLANVLSAYEQGARLFDASLGGFGGCPYAPGATGNIAMDDLVFMLEAMGIDTGVDVEQLLRVRGRIEEVLETNTFHGAVATAGLPKNFYQM